MTLAKVEENLGTESPLPQGWRWVRLEDICDINPSRPAGFQRASDAITTFVPMSAVDEHRDTILSAEIRPFSEVAKGYTFFSEGDILFAKITPCMQNGKQAIARGLIDGIGFGSTEFHVIRPRPGVTPEWICRFVRQPHVLSAAANHFTGAVGQQRVPESFLASLEIPLPSIDEQDRIMHIVNEQMATVEKARAAAEARLEAAKALPAAYLGQVLPQPGQELPNGWQWVRLGEVCEFLDSQRVPVNDKERQRRIAGKSSSNLYPYYGANGQVGWIDDYIFDEPLILLAEDGGFFGSREHPVAYKIIGKSWVNNHAHVLRPRNGADFGFCLHALAIRPDIGTMVTGNTRPKLNQEIAAQIPIPLPSLVEQKHIAAVLNEQMEKAGNMVQTIHQELEMIDALPAALLRRAFSGGL